MNRLSKELQAQFAGWLVEGNSIRAGCRKTGSMTLNTGLRYVKWFGAACQEFLDAKLQNLNCTDIEVDETWSYIGGKTKNLPEHMQGSKVAGDMWTWISICKKSRLVINWHVGKHDPSDAFAHISELARRVPGKVQITTDQLAQYRPVIEQVFGPRADYATVKKKMHEPQKSPDLKYTQPEHKETRRVSVFGNPDMTKVSTNKIERQNLTLRMSSGRYRRASNTYSKNIENNNAALALHYMYYNFCRIHSTLRVTPAMEAGIADHVWEMSEVVDLLKF